MTLATTFCMAVGGVIAAIGAVELAHGADRWLRMRARDRALDRLKAIKDGARPVCFDEAERLSWFVVRCTIPRLEWGARARLARHDADGRIHARNRADLYRAANMPEGWIHVRTGGNR